MRCAFQSRDAALAFPFTEDFLQVDSHLADTWNLATWNLKWNQTANNDILKMKISDKITLAHSHHIPSFFV